jgi:sugar O-acyltransferase (sialic acid O-acetyltransferase NeuD family)
MAGGERKLLGIYGSGGFGREVMHFVSDYISRIETSSNDAKYRVFFVETNPHENQINGYPVVSEEDFLRMECEERYFNIAIGDSKVRERIAINCINLGLKPMTIQSPHSIIYDCNQIAEGALICANSMITSNTRIGKFFHCNIYSYVAHDCVIGDYVTFAPSVHCNGNVHIHEHAYIGTNVTIKHGLPSRPLIIGKGAVVGMGAVVTNDIPPFSTVVGNPARPLKKE